MDILTIEIYARDVLPHIVRTKVDPVIRRVCATTGVTAIANAHEVVERNTARIEADESRVHLRIWTLVIAVVWNLCQLRALQFRHDYLVNRLIRGHATEDVLRVIIHLIKGIAELPRRSKLIESRCRP